MVPPEIAESDYVRLSDYQTGPTVFIVVWAVADGGELLVWLRRNSGTVKRLREVPWVWVSPRFRTNVLEPFPDPVLAYGRVDDSPEGMARAHTALSAKYGWSFRLAARLGEILRVGRRAKSVCLALRFVDLPEPGTRTRPNPP